MGSEKLTPDQAKLELFFCLEGSLRETGHFREKLHKEGVTFGDSTSMMEYGRIYEPAEWDEEHHEWKYKIEGLEPDGKWLVIVFSLSSPGVAKLITVYSSKPRPHQRR